MSKERDYLQKLTKGKQLNLIVEANDEYVAFQIKDKGGNVLKQFKVASPHVRISGRAEIPPYEETYREYNEYTSAEALEVLNTEYGNETGHRLITWDTYVYINDVEVHLIAILPMIDRHTRYTCRDIYLPEGEYKNVAPLTTVCDKMGVTPPLASGLLKSFLSNTVTSNKVYTMKLLKVLKANGVCKV